jgi:trimeric autotransporter adhesin
MRIQSLFLISSLAAIAACSDDSTSPGPTAGNPDGRLQVIPGVAALSAVDVVVDGKTKLTNAAYGVPTSPIALSLGQHQVKVVPAGTAASAGGVTVTLRAGDTTRVVVIGTATNPTPVALGDTGATPVPGKGKLRVSHLAANAPPIDVYRTQPDFGTFVKFMDPFPYQSASPFIESTPGNWVIRVTAKGTNQVLAESGPIRVDALWIRTVLLLDAPNGGIRITPLGDQ